MGKNRRKKWKVIAISMIFLLLFHASISLASDSIFVWSENTNEVSRQNRTTDAVQTNATQMEEMKKIESNDALKLESGGAILIEQYTGKVLYGKNIHEALRPASVTKVMTILLIMEALEEGRITLTDRIPCSENASKMGGSQIWLDVKEQLTVDEMLKAICVVSANDCTVAMAEYLAGSEEAFVEQMNKRAKELGMNDTTFKNCHGIDEDGHVTSPYDIAMMSRELLKEHPSITKYTTIWMDSLRDGKSELVNTNKLIRNYQGATGLKTGSTSIALYNLSASATRNNLNLIAVIMKAPTTKIRFEEAQKLLDYGFSNYSYKELSKQGDFVTSLDVQKGLAKQVDAVLEKDCGTLLKKGQDKNITQEMTLPEKITAPILKGQKLGEITYLLDGQTIEKVNIIARTGSEKNRIFSNVYGYLI